LEAEVKEIRIFSRDEKKQDDMCKKYSHPKFKLYIGDVREYRSVGNVAKGEFLFLTAINQSGKGQFLMKILVLGVTGMLGSAVFKFLSNKYDVWGTVRSSSGKGFFSAELQEKMISGIDVLNQDELVNVLAVVKPDIVVNCVGLIKQHSNAKNPLFALPINSMFPHRLARLCGLTGTRVVHISTDCVFSGDGGMYVESDISDTNDIYGKSKYIGELNDYAHCITLRTSIIGHELNSNASLVDWFLGQGDQVKGFTKAIFSGFPTVELAKIIQDYVIPHSDLFGVYHVSAEPIDKCTLLELIAEVYKKEIEIVADDTLVINRSLNSMWFKEATGYQPPSWRSLVQVMFDNR
jgi:dTDP-4-dehydrorhamnose reductase